MIEIDDRLILFRSHQLINSSTPSIYLIIQAPVSETVEYNTLKMSSDEDVPLSSLKRKTKKSDEDDDDDDESEEEAEFDEEDEDEEEDDDDDDNDSDEPLSSLKSPPRKKQKASTNTNKTKATSKSKSTTTTKKSTTSKKSSSTKTSKKKIPKKQTSTSSDSNSNSSASAALYASSKKGKLITELLRRWWYGITWPEPSTLPKTTPPNCDALDGFPGVYVTTSGEDIGKIIDFRNHETCPNFKNMSQKSSEDLKELLLRCIKEQTRVLIENEGEGTDVEKDLITLEKWVKKVNPKTADKEAAIVLKAAGF